jgi:hypothetical protein
MGSVVMIYISSFIKIGSDIRKFMVGIHRQHGDHISLLVFFQNEESRLILFILVRQTSQYCRIIWLHRPVWLKSICILPLHVSVN